MNHHVTDDAQSTIKTFMTIKNQVIGWYQFSGSDSGIIDFCNNKYKNSGKPILIIITNHNLMVNIQNNTLKLNGENLLNVRYTVEYFKSRIIFREAYEAELIDLVDNDLENHKRELNKIVNGLEEKVKCWDSERIQGMLFMCGYKFPDILDERTTDIAYVTFPESNISFIFLPITNQALYRYLINEKIKINFFITQRCQKISNEIDEFTKVKMEEMLSYKNIFQEIKLSDKHCYWNGMILQESKIEENNNEIIFSMIKAVECRNTIIIEFQILKNIMDIKISEKLEFWSIDRRNYFNTSPNKLEDVKCFENKKNNETPFK